MLDLDILGADASRELKKRALDPTKGSPLFKDLLNNPPSNLRLVKGARGSHTKAFPLKNPDGSVTLILSVDPAEYPGATDVTDSKGVVHNYAQSSWEALATILG